MISRTESGLLLYTDPKPSSPITQPEPPPRVSACPDCGGGLEASWEHETEYQMACLACMKVFVFETQWGLIGRPENVNRLKRSFAFVEGSHSDPRFIRSLGRAK